MTNFYSLSQLGWKAFFQQQLSLEEWETHIVGRVFGLERSVLHILTIEGKKSLPMTKVIPAITVGDWVLLDSSSRFLRLLERLTLFSRKAAGTKIDTQLIASNVDTVFVVSSMNQDFNLNRIERYLVLANDAGVQPVVVLTKVDICEDPADYIEKVQALDPTLEFIAVNSLDKTSVQQLDIWCKNGDTVALMGSSGVGKSTLINTILSREIQPTNAIRADDDKGRHTTTGRSIHLISEGGLLLDTPGMRELQLADCEHGIDETFIEITEIAKECKFSDCKHQTEPGCAIKSAIEARILDERRLISYQKLLKEQDFNTATLAEKRAKERNLGRYIRKVQDEKKGIRFR